jgi:uncharacterized OB-fold protein
VDAVPKDASLDDEQLVELFRAYALNHDNKAIFRARLDHELRMMRCRDCGTWHEPPKPICPACWSKHVEPTPVSGRGTIFMAIFLHQGPPTPGVDYTTPYPVVTVELDEQPGLRFTSTVVGAENEHIVIGAPVTLDWLDRDGVPVPVFRLAAGGRA